MDRTVKFSDLIGAERSAPVAAQCKEHGEFQQTSMMLRDRRAARTAASAGRAAEILAAAQLPKRFVGRTFETFIAETPEQRAALTTCRSYAENFDEHMERGDGLLLSGSVGCGKPHLAGCRAPRQQGSRQPGLVQAT